MYKMRYCATSEQRAREIRRAKEYEEEKRSDRALRDINIAVWLTVTVLLVAVMFF